MSLVVNSLSKSFFQSGQEIQVLKNLNCDFKDSEVVAIVGESGSGKSTLLALMAGLDKPDSGEILVYEKDLGKMNENEVTRFRSSHISIVFQQYHLIGHLTALENVMLPLEIQKSSDAEKKALVALGEVGISHRLSHLPSQLSGGECQRVAIARALVVKPKLLLADEPSGNLDSKTGARVMDYFFEVVSKYPMTTVLVTHSEILASRCQRVYKLESGQLKVIK